MNVLALNVGSSSLRAALFDVDKNEITEIDRYADAAGSSASRVENWIARSGHPLPQAIGHRIVHGGSTFSTPVVVNNQVQDQMRELVGLAPLHLPPALVVLDHCRQLFPDAVQVACFDTAFHATLPRLSYDLPLPRAIVNSGIRRYGFHGLNCEHVVRTVQPALLKRAVIAHLGSGCSLTAVRNGVSVDTTMGFTPNGGVPMATRSGDLDPGVLLELMRQGFAFGELEDLLTHSSGLRGWTGGVSDMRQLLDSDDESAAFAVEAFCHHIAKAALSLTASLGGLDTLIFTGGIGENASTIRDLVVARMAHLPPFKTLVVPAGEEQIVARHAASLAA